MKKIKYKEHLSPFDIYNRNQFKEHLSPFYIYIDNILL
jgi:hypothetical protein